MIRDTLNVVLINIIHPMFLNTIKDCCYSKFCVGCNRIGSFLCADCINSCQLINQPFLPKIQPFHLTQITSLYHYSFPISELLKKMKYRGVKEISSLIAQLLHSYLQLPKSELIISVPISSFKLLNRGFNQSESIAKELSKLCSIPYQSLLSKSHASSQVKSHHLAQRLSNLQSKIQLAPTSAHYAHSKILIVDDVVTSGQTLNQCALALKPLNLSACYGVTFASKQCF